MLNRLLQLTRPLAVLDLETTGINVMHDRIIQIAITIHYPDKDPIAWTQLVNPGIPIPAASTEAHGLTDADVRDAPVFTTMAGALASKLVNLDFAGYNVTFDLRVLSAEMARANVKWAYADAHVIDAAAIYFKRFPRNLEAAYREFVGPDSFKAHDAGADVRATEQVLAGQLERYSDLPRTIPELSTVCFPKAANADVGLDAKGKLAWQGDAVVLTFGKHRNIPLKKVPVTYLDWLLENDFPEDFKTIIRQARTGTVPTRS